LTLESLVVWVFGLGCSRAFGMTLRFVKKPKRDFFLYLKLAGLLAQGSLSCGNEWTLLVGCLISTQNNT